jgi:hypothetical protein
VVDLQPNTFFLLPIVIANWDLRLGRRFVLEVVPVRESAAFGASLIHATPEIFKAGELEAKPFTPFAGRPDLEPDRLMLECGGHIPDRDRIQRGRILTPATLELIEARFPRSWEAVFPSNGATRLPIELPPFDQTVMGLKIAVPRDAEPGQVIRLHFVQRSLEPSASLAALPCRSTWRSPVSCVSHRERRWREGRLRWGILGSCPPRVASSHERI